MDSIIIKSKGEIYYWKNVDEGYCVVVSNSYINIFPIIDDKTVYSPYKITHVKATDEEIRARYNKEKPTRFQQVKPSYFRAGKKKERCNMRRRKL